LGIVALVARVAIGVLLVLAGAIKLHDGAGSTASAIAAYRLLSPAVIAPLGIALPFVELVLGAYLVAGFQTRAAATIAALQFVVFAAAVGSLVVRNIPADCGCFGSALPTAPSWGHVAADFGLALLALGVARAGSGRFSVDRLLGDGFEGTERRARVL